MAPAQSGCVMPMTGRISSLLFVRRCCLFISCLQIDFLCALYLCPGSSGRGNRRFYSSSTCLSRIVRTSASSASPVRCLRFSIAAAASPLFSRDARRGPRGADGSSCGSRSGSAWGSRGRPTAPRDGRHGFPPKGGKPLDVSQGRLLRLHGDSRRRMSPVSPTVLIGK